MAKRNRKKTNLPATITAESARSPIAAAGIPAASRATDWKAFFLRALAIVVLGWWAYVPALHGSWLWDDESLISQNTVIQDPAGLLKIWFHPGSLTDFQPLKYTVVWLQWRLWGADTLGYHVTNVLLHLISASLVWRLLRKLGLRFAWLGGLIFAVHPIMVDSVAWMAELKNTLSLPPFLLSMCAWIDYDEHRKPRDYFLSLGLFVVAMLCKITMALFPVVILLYAWWKRGRIAWSDFRASIPFFAAPALLGLIGTLAIHSQPSPASEISSAGALPGRIAGAGMTVLFYIVTFVWPAHMLPMNPAWKVDPPPFAEWFVWPGFAAVAAWCWIKRDTWGRHALLGLGFFFINLAPVLGYIVVFYAGMVWALNHLGYIPVIGLIGLAAAGAEMLYERASGQLRPVLMAPIGLAAIALAWQSHRYARMFSSDETLWNYTLQSTPGSWEAHNNMGVALQRDGRIEQAVAEYRTALALSPDHADVHFNLGTALQREGRPAEAIDQMETAIRMKPDYPEARYSLAALLQQTGQGSQSIEQLEELVRVNPGDANVLYNLGAALQQANRVPEAIEQYRRALQINPADANVHYNLGVALQQAGSASEAIDQFTLALQINPDDAEAHYSLGVVLQQENRIPEAIEQYRQSLKVRPGDAEVHNDLGVALAQTGQTSEAVHEFEAALQIDPNFSEARNNLVRSQGLLKKNASVRD